MPKSYGLTPKQQLFVKEYLIDLNATEAAKRAGYSQNRASEIGYQLLQKTTIKTAIDKGKEKRAKKAELTAEEVLNGIRKDIDNAREVKQFGSVMRGYEMLGRHLALFNDKLDVNLRGVLGTLNPEEKRALLKGMADATKK